MSPHTQDVIDAEVQRIIDAQHTRAQQLLSGHRGALDVLTATLLASETLDGTAVRHVIDSTPSATVVPIRLRGTHASIATTLNIYTHVVDASHRKAVEAVEQRLFDDVVPNGPKSADRLAQAVPVSDAVN